MSSKRNLREYGVTLDQLEQEYISEYSNKDIDMGYLEDLEYDKATAREMYYDFQIDKFYK